MEKMVRVKNMVNSTVVIKKLEYGVNRKWVKKGQVQAIPFDTLEQILYVPGIRHMFDSGILYIDDLKIKQELGLEPADVDSPENIIVLDDSDMEFYWKDCPIDLFKNNVANLSKVQIDNLISYAVENEIVNTEKCRFVKELTNKDILKTITRRQEIKEAEEREEMKNQAYSREDGRR